MVESLVDRRKWRAQSTERVGARIVRRPSTCDEMRNLLLDVESQLIIHLAARAIAAMRREAKEARNPWADALEHRYVPRIVVNASA
jgi:hypothetical protein